LANGQLWRFFHGATNMFQVAPDLPTDYRGLASEKNGPLWVGTDRQLFSVNWRSASSSAALPIDQTLSPGRKLDMILASREGGYWRLAGRIEKWRSGLDRPELDFGFYPWGLTSSAGNWQLSRPNAVTEDRNGNLIVGTLGSGLYWFDANGGYTHISTNNQALSNNYVFALHVDREGDLWVGTDGGGLNRVKRAPFELVEPTRDLVVQSVAADEQGGLWIACNGSPLLYWKDGSSRQLSWKVRTVYTDRQNRVWAGTWGLGLREVLTNRQQQFVREPGWDETLQNVSALHQDKHGRLWVGTQRGLAWRDGNEWRTLNRRGGLSAESILALADDAEGNLWIGTEGGGLNRWREGQVTVYRQKDNELPSDYVSSLYVDSSDALWVGTDGGGLARYHQGKWTRYSGQMASVSTSIGYIIEDDQGYLWIGSNTGLMRARKQLLEAFATGATNQVAWRMYGRPEGLPIRECSSGTQPGPARTPNGKLYFPTIKGLAVVAPADLRPNTNPPPVRIEAVLVDGQIRQENALRSGPLKSMVIPAGKQRLEIQFSSLNLAAPERTRFKYRLTGQGSDWVDAGPLRAAHYTRLPPAEYEFQVIASNEDGVWSNVPAALAFRILPPFWRTWWFIGSSVALVLGVVAGTVHYLSTQRLQRQVLQLRQQEALEKERARIARDIHDQLGASLTQVALLGELVEGDKDDPIEVEGHAQQICQTARDTTRVLDEIVWAVNPANDTLEGLMTYICKYTQEYLSVAEVHYRLDVPEQLPATPLPPDVRHNVFLACKEAVTNVVRHAQASAVWIRLRLLPGAFALEVEDNGRGIDAAHEKSGRNGLRNMRKRMEEIGAEFAIAPAPEGGTVVRFTVPLARLAERDGRPSLQA
jgi:signal transduction histidine kinase/sugar lactone lactonase YvrE